MIVTSLYVEKDLAAICKAVFDIWETNKASLDGKYLLASGARETQGQINEVLERGMSDITRPGSLITLMIPFQCQERRLCSQHVQRLVFQTVTLC
jgi:hypothetical protein